MTACDHQLRKIRFLCALRSTYVARDATTHYSPRSIRPFDSMGATESMERQHPTAAWRRLARKGMWTTFLTFTSLHLPTDTFARVEIDISCYHRHRRVGVYRRKPLFSSENSVRRAFGGFLA